MTGRIHSIDQVLATLGLGLLLLVMSCSKRPAADEAGRAGTVIAKGYRPSVPDVPASWNLTIKRPDGTEQWFFVDETRYHAYEVGDRYP